MNQIPLPSTYGQTIDYNRRLFKDLLQAGYNYPEILAMSLRKALLARYGSIPAIDQALGENTYWGVKQVCGALSTWRKAWSGVRKEQQAPFLARMAALEALGVAVEGCRAAAVPHSEILNHVQKLLNPSRYRLAS